MGDKDGPDTGSANRWFYGETPDDFCGRYRSNCTACLGDDICSFCISGPNNTGSCLSVANNDGNGPDACLDWRHSVSSEPEDLNETCMRPLPTPPVANITVNTTANYTRRNDSESNSTNLTNATNTTGEEGNLTQFNFTCNMSTAKPAKWVKPKKVYHKQHAETKQVTINDLLVSDRPHGMAGEFRPRNVSNVTSFFGNLTKTIPGTNSSASASGSGSGA